MSNARSPREVCSTTIGTRGLMANALFLLLGRNPSGAVQTTPERRGNLSNGLMPLSPGLGPRSPELRGLLLGLFLRCPELLARLGLLGRNRLGGVHEQVNRL